MNFHDRLGQQKQKAFFFFLLRILCQQVLSAKEWSFIIIRLQLRHLLSSFEVWIRCYSHLSKFVLFKSEVFSLPVACAEVEIMIVKRVQGDGWVMVVLWGVGNCHRRRKSGCLNRVVLGDCFKGAPFIKPSCTSLGNYQIAQSPPSLGWEQLLCAKNTELWRTQWPTLTK